jgi:microcystin-dependent protein
MVGRMDGMLGEVRLIAGRYAPAGWLPCDGREVEITDHVDLFALIGTYYGGNGKSTFGLPALQAAVPVGSGDDTYHQGEERWIATTAEPSEGAVRGLGMNYVICVQGSPAPRAPA